MLPLPESPEEEPSRPHTSQSAPPPDAHPPRRRLTGWLDQHAHPESRTFRYLDLVRALIQVLAVAGLLGLVVQLREANTTAKRDAYNRSVDAALLNERLVLDNPDLACVFKPEGPGRQLELSELRAFLYIEMTLDSHERLWQQHQEGIFDDEEWEPWQRWFRDGIVTGEMFPAVWMGTRDYYQDDFARYVDGVVAEEGVRRAGAANSAGGTPVLPRTLADYDKLPPESSPAC